MIEAIGGIYLCGFVVSLMIGIFFAVDKSDATLLLLSPVWPVLYLKLIWNVLKS